MTGGDVYHGPIFEHLRDKFIFADFCSGEVLAIGPTDKNETILCHVGFGKGTPHMVVVHRVPLSELGKI